MNSYLDQNYFFHQAESFAFCVNLHKVKEFFLLHIRNDLLRNLSDIHDVPFFAELVIEAVNYFRKIAPS